MIKPPLFETPLKLFLRQPIVNIQYFYFDYWSIIHFCSGLIFGLIFAILYKKRQAWLVVLTLLIIYEIFERLFDNIIFVPESITDKIWDIIIGMTGFLIIYRLLKIQLEAPLQK